MSLTSTIFNAFERIIRNQVIAFLNRQGHMNNTHYGFRSDRSCLSALLDVFDDRMLISDINVDMTYLDLQRYSTRWIMVYCCTNLGITCILGVWLFQFLTNRTHYVRIPGDIIKDGPVLSGVPRGTVLIMI